MNQWCFGEAVLCLKHKYGVKFYELCESDGLILHSFIYSGLPYPDTHDLGQTAAIVLKLMKYFLGKQYSVFGDNFYNSVKLAKHLWKQKTYICGTLCGDRKENPKEIVKKKLKKGKFVWKRSDDIVPCKWKGKRDVFTIFNKRSFEMVPVPNKRRKLTTNSNIVHGYNNGMSEVDQSDNIPSCYQGLGKCIRWYKKIGVYFLDILLNIAIVSWKLQNPAPRISYNCC